MKVTMLIVAVSAKHTLLLCSIGVSADHLNQPPAPLILQLIVVPQLIKGKMMTNQLAI